MSCPSPETWVAWILGEAGNEEGLESHLFECAACTVQAEGIERLVRELNGVMPMLLTAERRKKLEGELGAGALPIVPVSPGDHATLELGPEKRVGLWILRADVQGAERLDCELLTLDGQRLANFTDIPFDRERGEVALCCQLHYRELGPPEMRARVSSVEAGGARPLAEYWLNHVFSV